MIGCWKWPGAKRTTSLASPADRQRTARFGDLETSYTKMHFKQVARAARTTLRIRSRTVAARPPRSARPTSTSPAADNGSATPMSFMLTISRTSQIRDPTAPGTSTSTIVVPPSNDRRNGPIGIDSKPAPASRRYGEGRDRTVRRSALKRVSYVRAGIGRSPESVRTGAVRERSSRGHHRRRHCRSAGRPCRRAATSIASLSSSAYRYPSDADTPRAAGDAPGQSRRAAVFICCWRPEPPHSTIGSGLAERAGGPRRRPPSMRAADAALRLSNGWLPRSRSGIGTYACSRSSA